jgi:hypothetical protein
MPCYGELKGSRRYCLNERGLAVRLSNKARTILQVAVNAEGPGAKGVIVKVPNQLGQGLIIGGGNKLIDAGQPDRDDWIDALDELVVKQLVAQEDATLYRVTPAGILEAMRS